MTFKLNQTEFEASLKETKENGFPEIALDDNGKEITDVLTKTMVEKESLESMLENINPYAIEW